MNLLILIGICTAIFTLFWIAQSVVLLCHGERTAAPLRYRTQQPGVRWAGRVLLQLSWLALLIGFPTAIGIAPWQYWSRRLAMPHWDHVLLMFIGAGLTLALVYGFEFSRGWLRFQPQGEKRTRRRKLVRRFLTFIPLALMEEAVFRGVLLQQLYEAFPKSVLYAIIAVLLTAVIFSAAHFVRPGYPGKPVRQAGLGLFLVGCALGFAYVAGRRTLWLPVAIHSAGILGTEVMKLYVEYTGPPTLIGSPTFPYAGVCGLFGLFVIAALVGLVAL